MTTTHASGLTTGGIGNLAVQIIRLAADGKLDRLDLQILALKSHDSGIGYKRMGKVLGVPVGTIQSRSKKIRGVLVLP
jgi:hypothetical protein